MTLSFSERAKEGQTAETQVQSGGLKFSERATSVGAPAAEQVALGVDQVQPQVGPRQTFGLTPEQEQTISEIEAAERSIPARILSPITAAGRFVTGAPKASESIRAKFERKNFSESVGESPVLFQAKELVQTGREAVAQGIRLGTFAFSGPFKALKAAPFLARAAATVGNAATLAVLNGGAEGVAKILETGDLEEGLEVGKRVGAVTGILGAGIPAVVGGVKLVGKPVVGVTKKGLEKVARPIQESDISKVLVREAQLAKKAVSQKKAALSFRIKKAETKLRDAFIKGQKSSAAQIKAAEEAQLAKVSQQIGAAEDAIDVVNKSNEKLATTQAEAMTTNLADARKVFKQGYTELLQGKRGDLPVNLDTEIDDILVAMDIPAVSGGAIKTKLTALAKGLLDLGAGGANKEVQNNLKRIAAGTAPVVTEKGVQAGIALKDAHWIKQAVWGLGDSLKQNPANQVLGFRLLGIADDVANKIDGQVGGDYATLSQKWRGLRLAEDKVDSAIGRVETLPTGEVGKFQKVRKGTQKVSSEIEKIVKSGADITDDVIELSSDPIKAVHAENNILKQAGLTEQAAAQEARVQQIADNFNSVKNHRDTTKALATVLKKDAPEVAELKLLQKANKEKFVKQMDKVRKGQLAEIRKLSLSSEALDNQIAEATAKIIKHDDITVIASSIVGRSILGLIGAPAPLVLALDGLIAAMAMRRYGGASAAGLINMAEVLSANVDKLGRKLPNGQNVGRVFRLLTNSAVRNLEKSDDAKVADMDELGISEEAQQQPTQ